MEIGHDLFDGFQELLGSDFASGAFVGSRGSLGDAVFAIIVPPSLDGSPGEAT